MSSHLPHKCFLPSSSMTFPCDNPPPRPTFLVDCLRLIVLLRCCIYARLLSSCLLILYRNADSKWRIDSSNSYTCRQAVGMRTRNMTVNATIHDPAVGFMGSWIEGFIPRSLHEHFARTLPSNRCEIYRVVSFLLVPRFRHRLIPLSSVALPVACCLGPAPIPARH